MLPIPFIIKCIGTILTFLFGEFEDVDGECDTFLAVVELALLLVVVAPVAESLLLVILITLFFSCIMLNDKLIFHYQHDTPCWYQVLRSLWHHGLGSQLKDSPSFSLAPEQPQLMVNLYQIVPKTTYLNKRNINTLDSYSFSVSRCLGCSVVVFG